jgi:hypothetical protein
VNITYDMLIIFFMLTNILTILLFFLYVLVDIKERKKVNKYIKELESKLKIRKSGQLGDLFNKR